MNRTTSTLRLPSQPPVRFAFASASKAQLRYLWAALALCTAMIAATPAYSDSRTAHQDGKNVAIGSIQLDNRTSFGNESDASPTFNVLPNKKTILNAWVEYNTRSCAEISAGAWKINSSPKYGKVTTGILVARLGGPVACSGHTFSFRAIYYTWTKLKVNGKAPKTDKFAATWAAGPFKHPETFNFNLK